MCRPPLDRAFYYQEQDAGAPADTPVGPLHGDKPAFDAPVDGVPSRATDDRLPRGRNGNWTRPNDRSRWSQHSGESAAKHRPPACPFGSTRLWRATDVARRAVAWDFSDDGGRQMPGAKTIRQTGCVRTRMSQESYRIYRVSAVFARYP
jgi:hypothetical protein